MPKTRRYMSLCPAREAVVAQARIHTSIRVRLSPVISIEQKTLTSNPRSTVGTMTDISSYLNLLFATIGQPHCPRTGESTPSRSASQILEAILSLPAGTEIELRAPVFKVYGEELDFVFTELRKKGCRQLIIDRRLVDISADVDLDESKVRNMDAVVDRFVVGRKHEKAISRIAITLLVGDGLLQVTSSRGRPGRNRSVFTTGCAAARITSSTERLARCTSSSTTRKARARRAAASASISSHTRICSSPIPNGVFAAAASSARRSGTTRILGMGG